MITPLVLAMPRPMAEALGWPEAEIGWADVLALSQDPRGLGGLRASRVGRLQAGQDQPQLLLVGAVGHGGHLLRRHRQDLRAHPGRHRLVADGRVRARGRGGHGALRRHHHDLPGEHAARGPGGAAARLRVGGGHRGGLDHRLQPGRPRRRGPGGPHPAATCPLVAIYPKEGTLFSDNPAYVLDASWVSDGAAAGRPRLPLLRHRRAREPGPGAGLRVPAGQPGGAGGRPDLHGQRPEPVAAQDRIGAARPGGAGRPGGLLGVVPQDGPGDHRLRRQRVDGRPGRRGLHQAGPGQAGGARLPRRVQARGRGGPLDLLHRAGRGPRLPGAAAAHAAVAGPGADRERRSPASSP